MYPIFIPCARRASKRPMTRRLFSPTRGSVQGLAKAAQHRQAFCRALNRTGVLSACNDRITTQSGIGWQAKDEVHACPGFAPRHDLRAAIMPVPAQNDPGLRPMGSYAPG